VAVVDVEVKVTVLPAQTELGPDTTPVSLNLYTVLLTVAVIEPHEFVTVYDTVVVLAGLEPITPPIVPVDELIVPTAVLDDTHVPPVVPVVPWAINVVAHNVVLPVIVPGLARFTVTPLVGLPHVCT
jgi:hypothetical protein